MWLHSSFVFFRGNRCYLVDSFLNQGHIWKNRLHPHHHYQSSLIIIIIIAITISNMNFTYTNNVRDSRLKKVSFKILFPILIDLTLSTSILLLLNTFKQVHKLYEWKLIANTFSLYINLGYITAYITKRNKGATSTSFDLKVYVRLSLAQRHKQRVWL